MSKPPIVAVGFLTQLDLERLGRQFTNHIPVAQDDMFADILAQLDEIDIEQLGPAIVLKPKSR